MNILLDSLLITWIVLIAAYLLHWLLSLRNFIKFRRLLREKGSDVLGEWVTAGPPIDVFAAPIRLSIYFWLRSYKKESDSEVQALGRRCAVDAAVFWVLLLAGVVLLIAIILISRAQIGVS